MSATPVSPLQTRQDSPAARQADQPTALELRGLKKRYAATRRSPERSALGGLDLVVPAGQWISILGPNGSGKSTLVRLLAGSEAADEGDIWIGGRRGGASAPARDRRWSAAGVGIVFQQPGLDRLLTVRENLEAQASLFGLRAEVRRKRIARLAEEFEFADRLNDAVAALSGGLQRRVDLARALLHEPELLILDEATAGLDHQSRSGFLDLIARLRRQRPAVVGLTVLMTTHLMDEAERTDRVIMMARGVIVGDGDPSHFREACGGRVLRVHPTAKSGTESLAILLRNHGLVVEPGEGGALVARSGSSGGLDSVLEQAVLELARIGAAFELAPPDLGDAYLACTGRSLGADHGERPT